MKGFKFRALDKHFTLDFNGFRTNLFEPQSHWISTIAARYTPCDHWSLIMITIMAINWTINKLDLDHNSRVLNMRYVYLGIQKFKCFW